MNYLATGWPHGHGLQPTARAMAKIYLQRITHLTSQSITTPFLEQSLALPGSAKYIHWILAEYKMYTIHYTHWIVSSVQWILAICRMYSVHTGYWLNVECTLYNTKSGL